MRDDTRPLAPATAPAGARGELAQLLRLALPLAVANLLQMAIYATDVMFIARLGAQPLAASSLGVSIVGLLLWATTGLVSAASAIIAAELGRRRHAVREVRRTVRMALWLAMFASAGAVLVCLAAEPFMRMTGQSPALSRLSADFVQILMWSLFPALVANVQRVFVSALGRAGIATAITLMALLVNAFGNWLLVFGHMGFPAMGLAGSAIASIATNVAMVAAYAVIIRRDRRFRRYRLMGRIWRAEWARLADIARLGIPVALTILAEAGLFSGAAFLMGRIGEVELAAHTVALQIAALAFQVPFGIAQAATIRVGLSYGAGDARGVARAGWTALALGIGFMGVTASLIWLTPRLLVSVYVDVDAPANAAMVALAVQYLAIAAAFQLFDGGQAVAAGVLRGVQDTRVPMVIAIAGYWIAGYGIALWLGFWTPLAGLGVWAGLAAGLVVVAAMLIARWTMRERLGLVTPR